LVAADFIEISRLGTIRSRADNMREVATGDLKLLTIKYDSLDVRIYGDVALLTGIADNTGMYRGTVPFSGKTRYTRVFVWQDGRWQAVSMQQTPMS
jgi:ketosteroid isomerase-like protein